ncbi:MAG: DoxX family protein [Brumimicrobium sp.]|nr:DoxX family protein [Brumimicrobium sp.]
MKVTEQKIVEWFLRIAISIGFLSAVADRFGLWKAEISAWGNWDSFISYTHLLSPWAPSSIIGIVGGLATFLEVFFAVILLTNYKTSLFAKGAGFLLLTFGLSMALFVNVKAPLDYSVFMGSASAFALGYMTKGGK